MMTAATSANTSRPIARDGLLQDKQDKARQRHSRRRKELQRRPAADAGSGPGAHAYRPESTKACDFR
jgi:hypothetical protein